MLAGCGGDDKATQPEPPATTATAEAATDLPESGAAKLTSDQQKALLAKNNEIAVGGYDPSTQGPAVARNFRAYAEPLRAGKCKQALTASADTWVALGKADTAGDAAAQKALGKKVLQNSTRVFNSC